MRFDKDGHWHPYTWETTNRGLPQNLVTALAPGSDGDLWVGTGEGLARFDKDGRWQNYTTLNTNGVLGERPYLTRLHPLRMALSGLQPMARWRGSTRTDTGRTTAKPTRTAAYLTIELRRWQLARMAPSG